MNLELEKQIDDSIPRIERMIRQKTSLDFADIHFEDLKDYNHGIGTLIRLKILRKNSPLYKCFVVNGIKDKDEMTRIILEEYFKSKKSLNFYSNML